MLVSEDAEPKGPPPGFAHLLPLATLAGEGPTDYRPRLSCVAKGGAGWERVAEGRVRALCPRFAGEDVQSVWNTFSVTAHQSPGFRVS